MNEFGTIFVVYIVNIVFYLLKTLRLGYIQPQHNYEYYAFFHEQQFGK
jgi:hypothetical protein